MVEVGCKNKGTEVGRKKLCLLKKAKAYRQDATGQYYLTVQ